MNNWKLIKSRVNYAKGLTLGSYEFRNGFERLLRLRERYINLLETNDTDYFSTAMDGGSRVDEVIKMYLGIECNHYIHDNLKHQFTSDVSEWISELEDEISLFEEQISKK